MIPGGGGASVGAVASTVVVIVLKTGCDPGSGSRIPAALRAEGVTLAKSEFLSNGGNAGNSDEVLGCGGVDSSGRAGIGRVCDASRARLRWQRPVTSSVNR